MKKLISKINWWFVAGVMSMFCSSMLVVICLDELRKWLVS